MAPTSSPPCAQVQWRAGQAARTLPKHSPEAVVVVVGNRGSTCLIPKMRDFFDSRPLATYAFQGPFQDWDPLAFEAPCSWGSLALSPTPLPHLGFGPLRECPSLLGAGVGSWKGGQAIKSLHCADHTVCGAKEYISGWARSSVHVTIDAVSIGGPRGAISSAQGMWAEKVVKRAASLGPSWGHFVQPSCCTSGGCWGVDIAAVLPQSLPRVFICALPSLISAAVRFPCTSISTRLPWVFWGSTRLRGFTPACGVARQPRLPRGPRCEP